MHPERFKSVVLLFFTWIRVLVGDAPLKLAISTPLERSAVKNLFLVICARLEVHVFVKKWRNPNNNHTIFCGFNSNNSMKDQTESLSV